MTNRVQRQIIIDALDNEDLLSDWESDFINDIADYDNDKELTHNQNKILNKIGNRIAENT